MIKTTVRKINDNKNVAWLLTSPRKLSILILLALGLVYAGWLTYVISADRPLDFYVYYLAAESVARGQSPYTISDPAWDELARELEITNYTRPYRYPPYTAVFLALFRPLGPKGTMVVWALASAVAMIGGAWLVGRALGGRWWTPLSLAILLFFVPPLATLLAGQINGFLFLCLALALWAVSRQRAGWLGTSLALGTALKIIPLALILYLFWRRQWQAGLISILGLVLLTIIAGLVVGWAGLTDYARSAISLGRPDLVFVTPTNQTITAVLGRTFPASPALALIGGRWLGLFLVLITMALCWPVGGAARWMPLEFGLIVAALQLLPPFTWYHQLVLLHLPFLIAWRWLWMTCQQRWLILLVTLFVLTNMHGLTWHYLEQWPWLTSFPFLFGLILWVILAWGIGRGKWHEIGT